MTTNTTTATPELVDRITRLREQIEGMDALWSAVAEYRALHLAFDLGAANATDEERADALEASGLNGLCDLFETVHYLTCQGPRRPSAERCPTIAARYPHLFV